MKIKFQRRNFSEDLVREYPNSVFLDEFYNDAVIGLTSSKRIVYHHEIMVNLILQREKESGNLEEFEFEDDIEMFQHGDEIVYDDICHLGREDNPLNPLFCYDIDFLCDELHNTIENRWYELEFDEEEEQ